MDTSNRRRRAQGAAPHRRKPPTPPRSPSPTRSPLRGNSDTSLPLKREVLLEPSAYLHVSAPKLLCAHQRGRAGRGRHPNPDLVVASSRSSPTGARGKDGRRGPQKLQEGPARSGERVEPVHKDGKSKGHEISNLQGKNRNRKDNITGTSKKQGKYD